MFNTIKSYGQGRRLNFVRLFLCHVWLCSINGMLYSQPAQHNSITLSLVEEVLPAKVSTELIWQTKEDSLWTPMLKNEKIAYFQVDALNANPKYVRGINSLLYLWHRYSWLDFRIAALTVYPRYSGNWFRVGSNPLFATPEEAQEYDMEFNPAKPYTKKQFKLSQTDSLTYLPSATDWSDITPDRPIHTLLERSIGQDKYLFKAIGDSLLVLFLDQSSSGGQKSFIFNLNTGREITFYDFIDSARKKDFLYFVFERIERMNKRIIDEVTNYSITTESAQLVSYGVNLFPNLQIRLNESGKVVFDVTIGLGILGSEQYWSGIYYRENYNPVRSTFQELEQFFQKDGYYDVLDRAFD